MGPLLNDTVSSATKSDRYYNEMLNLEVNVGCKVINNWDRVSFDVIAERQKQLPGSTLYVTLFHLIVSLNVIIRQLYGVWVHLNSDRRAPST